MTRRSWDRCCKAPSWLVDVRWPWGYPHRWMLKIGRALELVVCPNFRKPLKVNAGACRLYWTYNSLWLSMGSSCISCTLRCLGNWSMVCGKKKDEKRRCQSVKHWICFIVDYSGLSIIDDYNYPSTLSIILSIIIHHHPSTLTFEGQVQDVL